MMSTITYYYYSMKLGENTFAVPAYIGYYFAIKLRMDESVVTT
jgi:hypothetical protein